jgi:hypothetical protein
VIPLRSIKRVRRKALLAPAKEPDRQLVFGDAFLEEPGERRLDHTAGGRAQDSALPERVEQGIGRLAARERAGEHAVPDRGTPTRLRRGERRHGQGIKRLPYARHGAIE